MNELKEVQWTKDDMIEVNLKEPDDFLKVRETLTRIGVASRKEKKLYQSCHILHKKGQYYIVHFKELFALDGKKANLSENDVQRRNRIIKLLSDWGLVEIVKEDSVSDAAPLSQIKVIAYKEKGDWSLESKYNIGKKRQVQESLNRACLTLLHMSDTKPVVNEEKDNDEDKSEVLGNLVKVVVLIWSASLLTFSYVRLPNGQKILDFDPTFIASVFSGSLAAFGLSPAKNGSAPKKAPSIGKKEEDNAKIN